MVELEKGADMSMARDKDRDGDMDNNAMRIGACVPPQSCSPASSAEALQSAALDRLTAAGPRERRAVESRGTGAIFRRAATTDPTTTPETISVLMADSSDYSYDADYSYVYSYKEFDPEADQPPRKKARHDSPPLPLRDPSAASVIASSPATTQPPSAAAATAAAAARPGAVARTTPHPNARAASALNSSCPSLSRSLSL